MLSRVPRLLRNIIANCTGSMVSALVFFFLTPFVIGHLGAQAYGVWVLAHSIALYLGFFDLGMHSALVKYAAEAGARPDGPQQLQRLVGTTLVVFAAAGCAALAASGAIALFVAPHLDVPEALRGSLVGMLLILGLDVGVGFAGAVPAGLLEGAQRYGMLNRIAIGLLLARALASVALLEAGFGLVALAAVELGCSAIALVARAWIVRRSLPGFSFSLARFDRETWQRIRSYGGWSLLSEAAARGSTDVDKLFIPIFLSVALLTPYTVAVSISAVSFRVIVPLVAVLFPFSSELGARGDRQGLDQLLIRASKATLALATPLAIFVLLAAESIVGNWVGAEFAAEAVPVLRVVVPACLLSAALAPAGVILMGLGKAREMFWFSLADVALSTLLILASVGRYGLVGVATSCLVATLITQIGGMLPMALRTLGIPVRRYAREVFGGALLPALPALLLATLLVQLWYPSGWLSLGVECAAAVAAYALAFARFSVSERERAEIVHYASRWVAGGAG